jgi:glycosyltransferase involved in cell wall biosynthesis
MRHLWILNHYAIPPTYPGGTRHYDISRQLLQHGYDVTILASSFHHGERREIGTRRGGSYAIEEIDGIKFVWLRTFGYEGNNWRRLANMVSYLITAIWVGCRLPNLDARIFRPDVILGSSVHLLAVLAADLLARRFGSRFLMEVRDLWPQTLVDMGALTDHSVVTRVLRALEKHLYHRAEWIVVLLPGALEYISRLGIKPEKIRWIPNGVDMSRFAPAPSPAPVNNEFTVMYLGAHGRVNALDIIMDAAAIVAAKGYTLVRFLFIGDGPEKAGLVQRRDERGLGNVVFQDPVPKEWVPSVLQRADALVAVLQDLPLYKYGISLNKLYDYMASGKPILLAGSPLNNAVEESKCGLSVAPDDPEALAHAIIELYEMPAAQRFVMGQRGRAFVMQKHDYGLLAGRLAELLEGPDGTGNSSDES